MKTLAILSAYNEENKVGKSVKSIKPFVNKVLVIDDGSTDKTKIEAKKAGALVISHKKNLGVGTAFKTAIKYAQKNKFNICIPFAANNKDDGSFVPKFIKKIKDGYDFIQGSRYLKDGKIINQPISRTISTKLFSLIFSLCIGKRIKDATNGFRAYKIDIFKNKDINIWQEWLNRYEFEYYLLYKVIKNDYKFTEIPVTKRYPENKKEKYSKIKPIIDWWRIVRPLVYLRLGIKK